MTFAHTGHHPSCLVGTTTGQCTCSQYGSTVAIQTVQVNGSLTLKPCPGQCGGMVDARRSYCADCFEGALILNRNAVERARAETERLRGVIREAVGKLMSLHCKTKRDQSKLCMAFDALYPEQDGPVPGR